AAEIRRAGGAGLRIEHRLDRPYDGGARLRMAEVLQHHGRRPDGADRVGDALAVDVGRRAVHGLEERRKGAFGVDVSGRRDGDGAGAGGPEVRENVAEEVGGDDDVEPVRVLHEVRAEDVDV